MRRDSEPRTGKVLKWLLPTALWLLVLLPALLMLKGGAPDLPYSDFRAALSEDRLERVWISPTTIRGDFRAGKEPKAGRAFKTVRVEDPQLLEALRQRGVAVTGVPPSTFWEQAWPWLILLGVMGWLFLRGGGASKTGMLAVGRSKARVYAEKEVGVRFSDVAGVDEAKEELQEVIEFLRKPERFTRLGGKIPKGILLVGPPGTGKTLLARAVAGEAQVPFFSISGSEFVEMFVGVGAARVRDLFNQARASAPCIIFLDELDALGKARGMGPVSNDEREQTLNQLLVELDGFDPRVGVILMAATNRPEILDPALLRAGRFDRHVLVDRPDKMGRLAILRVHARNVPLAPGTDLDPIAAMTAGMVGADLANIVNEAALLAVRRGKDQVHLTDFEDAVERVVAGLEKRNRVLSRLEKERVAYHEVGHALVATALPGASKVQKISIIPRGIAALGYTIQRPTEDRFLMTQSELENKIAMLLGGRAAEELVFGELSTGAQDDLQKATDIARTMVVAYGMSPRLGAINLETERSAQFLEAPPQLRAARSDEVSRLVDAEVLRIIQEQADRATRLLGERVATLKVAAATLLEKETLSGAELDALLAARPRAVA
jgi:cell division protease FtsH